MRSFVPSAGQTADELTQVSIQLTCPNKADRITDTKETTHYLLLPLSTDLFVFSFLSPKREKKDVSKVSSIILNTQTMCAVFFFLFFFEGLGHSLHCRSEEALRRRSLSIYSVDPTNYKTEIYLPQRWILAAADVNTIPPAHGRGSTALRAIDRCSLSEQVVHSRKVAR